MGPFKEGHGFILPRFASEIAQKDSIPLPATPKQRDMGRAAGRGSGRCSGRRP